MLLHLKAGLGRIVPEGLDPVVPKIRGGRGAGVDPEVVADIVVVQIARLRLSAEREQIAVRPHGNVADIGAKLPQERLPCPRERIDRVDSRSVRPRDPPVPAHEQRHIAQVEGDDAVGVEQIGRRVHSRTAVEVDVVLGDAIQHIGRLEPDQRIGRVSEQRLIEFFRNLFVRRHRQVVSAPRHLNGADEGVQRSRAATVQIIDIGTFKRRRAVFGDIRVPAGQNEPAGGIED